jgi:hypothetical protein
MPDRKPKKPPPQDFAMPIANEEILDHFPNGQVPNPLPPEIYAPYAGKISVSRPFRQPLSSATDAASFAPGLELNFTDDAKASSVYAWLNGRLTWMPKKDTGDEDSAGLPLRASLRLAPNFETMTALGNFLQTFESAPAFTIYENMDATDVEQALGAVIGKAYDEAASLAQANWHPVLTDQFAPNQTVKAFIDAEKMAGPSKQPPLTEDQAITAAIKEITDSFIAAENNFIGFRVRAGDLLGHAALVPGNNDPAKARQIVFHTIDKGLQFINPLFYLHLYTKAPSGIVINFTLMGPDQPLLALYPELQGAARPRPRLLTDDAAQQAFIPAGWWANDHELPYASIPSWKYVESPNPTKPDDVKFDTTPHQPALDVAPSNAKQVGTFWNTYGQDITTFCRELAVPCELAMAICGHETSWKTNQPQQYRIEPLTEKQREKLEEIDLDLAWDYTAGIPAATDPPVKVTFKAASKVWDSLVSSSLDLTLISKQTLKKNQLVSEKGKADHRWVVIGDAYRPNVLANTASNANNTLNITVPDERVSTTVKAPAKGSVDVTPDGLGTLARAVTLRALRARTTPPDKGPKPKLAYPVTITVLFDTNPTPLTLTLAAGATSDGEINQTLIAVGNVVSLRVEGGAADASLPSVSLDIEIYLAPVNGDLVVVALGTDTGAAGVNPIPQPWVPDDFVRDGREGKSLTWAQLANALDALGGSAFSPGFMQTLIATAKGVLNQINTIDPEIFTRLNIPFPPANPSDYIVSTETTPGWLLVPRQSFFAGIGKMWAGYRGHMPGWDHPRVCSNYNDGGNDAKKRYGLLVFDDGTVLKPGEDQKPGYIDDAAARFGIVVDFFAALPPDSPVPSVRLKK